MKPRRLLDGLRKEIESLSITSEEKEAIIRPFQVIVEQLELLEITRDENKARLIATDLIESARLVVDMARKANVPNEFLGGWIATAQLQVPPKTQDVV